MYLKKEDTWRKRQKLQKPDKCSRVIIRSDYADCDETWTIAMNVLGWFVISNKTDI